MQSSVSNEDIDKKLDLVLSIQKDQGAKTDEMWAFFTELKISAKWTDRIVKYGFAMIVGVGSLILLYKNIFK